MEHHSRHTNLSLKRRWRRFTANEDVKAGSRMRYGARRMKSTWETAARAAIIGAAVLVGLAVGHSGAHAEGELRVLTWEGYTDPSFTDAFVKESGCEVSGVFVGSR